MTFGREAVHVDADLRNDDLGAQIADAGDGAQDLDRGAKGLDMGVDLLIDLTDSGVACSLPQMAGGSASALSLSRPAQALLALRPVGSRSHPR